MLDLVIRVEVAEPEPGCLCSLPRCCCSTRGWAGCARQGGLASLVVLVAPGVFALSEVTPARLLLWVLSLRAVAGHQSETQGHSLM